MRKIWFIMAFNDEWDNVDKAIKNLNESGANIEVVETPEMDVTDLEAFEGDIDAKVKMYLLKATEEQFTIIQNSCTNVNKVFTI